SAKCSAMYGNGRAAHTRLIPVTRHRPVLWANTMANLCAINTCCVAALARLLNHTFAERIEIFLRRTSAGNLWEFAWQRTGNERAGGKSFSACDDSLGERRLPRGGPLWAFSTTQATALQIFL